MASIRGVFDDGVSFAMITAGVRALLEVSGGKIDPDYLSALTVIKVFRAMEKARGKELASDNEKVV